MPIRCVLKFVFYETKKIKFVFCVFLEPNCKYSPPSIPISSACGHCIMIPATSYPYGWKRRKKSLYHSVFKSHKLAPSLICGLIMYINLNWNFLLKSQIIYCLSNTKCKVKFYTCFFFIYSSKTLLERLTNNNLSFYI